MILINGYFFCRKLTGIERYAYEITKRIDNLSLSGEISIIVPGNCDSVPDFKNLTVIRYKRKIPHILWQIFTLQLFLFLHPDYTILEFANTCLPFFPGIVFLHDIYCELFPNDFSGLKDKIVRLYNRWQYRLICKKAKKIITVSHYSKNQIVSSFKIDPLSIRVIGNGWEHFKSIESDHSVFDNFPTLLSKPFYFSLGSLSLRKNLIWIINYAKNHESELFVLSGTKIPTARFKDFNTKSLPENVLFLGYLEDSKVKALMEKCKAFIFPSYYEGFGIPPMEALSVGAHVIVADSSSLQEIYNSSVHYINPFDTDVDLNRLLKESVEDSDKILKKYSWDVSAENIYQIIRNNKC